MTWKVWTYPTSLTIGFQRSVVVEELDPALIAAVDQTEAVRYRPRTRYDRTMRYFATVSLGDSRSAIKASDVLVKVHAKAVGIEPLSGNPYDANDPHSQLWIHLTAWHSILYAYERYGPGRLTAAEESQYWEECAVAAELQTCSPDDVPRSREGIRQYFEEMRPKLAGSEAAQSMMDHLLNAEVMLPPAPRALRPATWIINKAMRLATIATMPQWMRKMAGLRQSRFTDALITPVMKVNFAVASRSKRLQLFLLPLLTPSTLDVVAPVFLNVPPQNPRTYTPAEAREMYGVLRPTEEYERFKGLVANKAAQREGLDFEEVLGPVA
ncbi:MAG: hypothetical protein QOG62_1489 [Thermoleophilaceae bacterium]|nr:hypothetical protein [Thermoleophilaceae bacterium]